jgi:hypothetical protein
VETLRALEDNLGIRQTLKTVEQHQALTCAALGPVDDLRRAGMFDINSPWQREMEQARQSLVDFEARFRLPGMGEPRA